MPTSGPSPHLSWAELACHDAARTPYPLAWRTTRAVVLAAEFESIRAVVGLPIQIGSGYRTVTHNRAVGGTTRSQHVEGRALDLYPPEGWTANRLYEVAHAIATSLASRLYGIGRYPTFVHVDVRPPGASDRLIAWRGSRAWAEAKA